MAISAGSVFVDLGARLDRREFDAYDKKLKETQERVARKERFKVELGAQYNERAFRAYERDLDRAQRANNDMIKSQGRLRTSFGSVWSKGGAAFAAAGGAFALVSGVKSIVSANADAEASQKRMEAQLKASGISYRAHADEIDAVIQKHSKLAGIDDEELADAFTKLVRSSGSVETAMKNVGLVTDVARARNIDASKAADLVGKVMSGQVTALNRYGAGVDKGASSTEALAKIQQRFGGQAEAYGKTQAGASDRLRVSWENLQETAGKRLGPTIARLQNRAAAFIDQMQTGEGAGGRFAHGLERVADAARIGIAGFNAFARAIRVGAGAIAGVLGGLLGAFSSIAGFLSHFPGMGFMKDVARGIDDARDSLDKFKKTMDVGVATRDMEDRIGRLRSRTRASMDDIRRDTAANMREIRRRLGSDSKEGADSLTSNFRAARTAIRRAMRDGTVSTREGMAEIKRLTRAELRELGISSLRSGQQNTAAASENARAQAVANRYTGGWIGAPGMVGADTVPAMLGVGEAVLNRHQQAIIEGLLGEGFLDRLFSSVRRPHYMAQGGIVSVPGFPGERAAASVIPMIEQIARRFALTLTDAFGSGHKSPGHTRYGTAADFAGPDRNMDAAVRSLVSAGYLVGYDGRFGSQRWPGHGPSYVAGGNAHLHVELGGKGGALTGAAADGATAGLWTDIRTPRVGGSGAMQAIVQGRLRQATRAINRAGRAVSATPVPGGGGVSSAGGQYDKAALMALWRQAGGPANVANLMAAIALAESGGNPNAHNPSGATGLWQILGNPFPGNARDPLTNARMAVSKYRSQGLGAWEAYTRGMHRQYLASGGRALPRGIGKATAGLIRKIKPLQTDRSARWDKLMGHVEAWDQDYSRWERRFNVTDEELVDSDTGQVNVKAIQRKADELGKLLAIRRRIEHELETARRVARTVIASYQRVLGALRRSLRHAAKKDRSGIRSYIRTYEGRVSDWQGRLSEAGDSAFDARTDVLSLRGELREVLGTAPEIRDTSGAADTGTADLGAAADATTDTTTAPASPLEIATQAAEQLRTYLSAAQDTFTGFGGNTLTPSGAYGPGGLFSGTPDQITALAGVRAFGAAGGGLGSGATIINNYHQLPDNTQTWSQQMRFQIER